MAANGRDGDDNRTSFTKINQMTEEIYDAIGDLGTAAAADVVGTVTDGSIIESGSNAKGNYTRFADGTQITWGAQVKNVAVAAGTGVSWDDADQPIPFLAGSGNVQTNVSFSFHPSPGGGGGLIYGAVQSYNNGVKWFHTGINMGTSPSASHPMFTYGTINALSYVVCFQSTGRWK